MVSAALKAGVALGDVHAALVRRLTTYVVCAAFWAIVLLVLWLPLFVPHSAFLLGRGREGTEEDDGLEFGRFDLGFAVEILEHVYEQELQRRCACFSFTPCVVRTYCVNRQGRCRQRRRG